MINQGEAVVLDDNREFLCFDKAELDGKQYLFLISVEESNEICFAEQALVDGEAQLRVIGNKEEKIKLAKILQQKAEANS